MSKNLVIGALSGVVLISILAYALFFKSSENIVTTENTQLESEQSATDTYSKVEDRGVTSFAMLMGRNEDVRCTYSTDAIGESSVPTNGEVFVSNGKIRVNTTMVQDNQETSFSFIDDGTNNYTWGDGSEGAFAMKSKRMEPAEMASQEAADTPAGFDYSQNVEYDCSAWSPDESVFVPPVSIEFMDIEAMMEGAGVDAEAMTELMLQAES